MVLFCAPWAISTPLIPFGSATAPKRSAPMMLPSMVLPEVCGPVLAPSISTPLPVLPEMTFFSPKAVPPMVLFWGQL